MFALEVALTLTNKNVHSNFLKSLISDFFIKWFHQLQSCWIELPDSEYVHNHVIHICIMPLLPGNMGTDVLSTKPLVVLVPTNHSG